MQVLYHTPPLGQNSALWVLPAAVSGCTYIDNDPCIWHASLVLILLDPVQPGAITLTGVKRQCVVA